MSPQEFERKLTAILSADVAGYSRLMGEDEELTIRTLTGHREMMDTLIREHKGRVVDSPGDNLLAVFSSVTRAVDCAVEIQREMAERNEELPDDRKMEYRIGVNLGDVIEEGNRIYGDGVNIAARLESLTEPGGICISGVVYSQVKNRLKLEYEYLGKRTVKNISEPVPVYRILSLPKTAIRPSVQEEQAYSLSDKPSIAVLPFIDLSPEKDQEYFADGIAEELLNYLTRISELEVRGRTSSFYFKDRKEDIRTISKMLNVGHILEGSVRKAGEKVRITVQLINTLKDAHIWSETYDRTMDDIFAIQDDIAQSVADAMQITLGVGELGRAPGMTSNIAAYDAYLAGRSLISKPGRENVSQAIERLELAVALDPDFAIGWDALADAYDNAIAFIPERAEEFVARRRAALSRVVELIPETDLALGIAASRSGDMVEVERLYKQALALDPANSGTNFEYGWFLCQMGRPTEAIDYIQRFVRLEPLSSGAHMYLGLTYEFMGNIDAAVKAMKKARKLTNQPTVLNAGLLVLAMEENNRALIDEYVALVVDTELHGNVPDIRDINQVLHALLDTPEEAGAELRIFLTDPAYDNPMNRMGIAVWASYFGEFELALQACRESIGSIWNTIWQIWRPIQKGMRQLPGFKDLVRETGLVDYWKATGNWGEFCRPVSDDDFECD